MTEPFCKNCTFWLVVASLCGLALAVMGCSSTSITSNCFDDAGEPIRCTTQAHGSTGGSSSYILSNPSPTGGAGSVSVSAVGGTGTLVGTSLATTAGGSGSEAQCVPASSVNWQCGFANGPAAGAPAGTAGDTTPSAQWICVSVNTPITPPNPTFGDHQSLCYSDYTHVCFHC